MAVVASAQITISNIWDGSAPQVYIRYSQSADGSSMTADPANASYMGIYVANYPPDGSMNALVNSDKEVVGTREFINSVNWDLAPLIDEYGIDQMYTVSFDLKAAVVGPVQVYCQNGSGSKYSMNFDNWSNIINATTEYMRYAVRFKPYLASQTETLALLAFYGTYDTGVIPSVKNVKFELGDSGDAIPAWYPSPEDANDYRKYRWQLVKGSQGIQGPKGADGVQYYTWVKFADTPTTGMSDSPTGKAYMGIAVNKTSATESTNYADYTWTLTKGDTGAQGPAGTNGQPTYTWVKYATSSSGANISDDPTGKTYIGLAYNKLTAAESTNPADYTWSLFKGDQGAKGDKGDQGNKGDKGDTGPAGSDAYIVVISNESHVFPASSSGVPVAGSIRVDVYAYKGATRIAATLGAATGLVTGITATPSGSGTTDAYYTIAVTTALTSADSGVITLPITVGGIVYNKTFSWSKAKAGATGGTGATGSPGANATAYWLILTAAAIQKSVDGVYSPASITLTAKSQTGAANAVDYAGRFKIEVSNDGASWTAVYTSSANEASKTFTIPAGIQSLRCSLYAAGGTSTLLDQQIVPIVSDGTSVRNFMPHRPSAWEQGYISTSTGAVSSSTIYLRTIEFIPVAEGNHYLTYYNGTKYRIMIYRYNSAGTFLGFLSPTANGVLTFAAGTAKIKVVLYYNPTLAAILPDEMALVKIMLEAGTTATDWTAAAGDADDTLYQSPKYKFKPDGLNIYDGGIAVWDGTVESPGSKRFDVNQTGTRVSGPTVSLESYTRLFLAADEGIYVGGGDASGGIYFVEDGTLNALDGNLNLTASGKINIGTVLYDNNAGATGTITLYESVARFGCLEIYLMTNAGARKYEKVYDPNGRTVNVNTAEVAGNTMYIDNCNVSINANKITLSSQNETALTAGGGITHTAVNVFKIIRVVGV